MRFCGNTFNIHVTFRCRSCSRKMAGLIRALETLIFKRDTTLHFTYTSYLVAFRATEKNIFSNSIPLKTNVQLAFVIIIVFSVCVMIIMDCCGLTLILALRSVRYYWSITSSTACSPFSATECFLLHFPVSSSFLNPYPTAFPYGNGMVLHFYQQQESSTTKTVNKVINKGLKAYV